MILWKKNLDINTIFLFIYAQSPDFSNLGFVII